MAYEPNDNIKILGWIIISITSHAFIIAIILMAFHRFNVVEKPSMAKKIITTSIGLKLKPKEAKFFADQHHSVTKENSSLLSSAKPKPKSFYRRKVYHKEDPLGLKALTKPLDHGYNDNQAEGEDDSINGPKTSLNAWQWQHAPFFNRIKAQIKEIWAPALAIARYDPKAELLAKHDRISVLAVSIDREGKLIRADIITSSGVYYLDNEAKRALITAAPFLYPPQELFRDKMHFTFTFAFHVLMDRGFSLSVDW